MSKPPATPPHSDIDGVNQDARVGERMENDNKDPGGAINRADEQSHGHPGGGGRQSKDEPNDKK